MKTQHSNVVKQQAISQTHKQAQISNESYTRLTFNTVIYN